MQSLVSNENIFRKKKVRHFQLKEKYKNFPIANRMYIKGKLKAVLQKRET